MWKAGEFGGCMAVVKFSPACLCCCRDHLLSKCWKSGSTWMLLRRYFLAGSRGRNMVKKTD
jgi:hypothetical protein